MVGTKIMFTNIDLVKKLELKYYINENVPE